VRPLQAGSDDNNGTTDQALPNLRWFHAATDTDTTRLGHRGFNTLQLGSVTALGARTMFSSEHETRIVTSQHPSGGITPSRYDLALHEYVQKQQEQRHQSSNLAIASSINKLIEGSADRISNFVSKFVAVLRAS
jgi:hypothetical protein